MNQSVISVGRGRGRLLRSLLLLGLVGMAGPGTAWGYEFRARETCQVASGETHLGDLYCMGRIADISGIQEGDLMAWAEQIRVSGELNGDLAGGARTITIDGIVRDSVRVGGSDVLVTGIIEGDLMAAGANVTVAREAHVTGDVLLCGNQLRVEGEVDGNLTAHGARLRMEGTVGGSLSGTTADVSISGQVGKEVNMTVDTIHLDPAARIQGDLIYEAREPVELEGESIVMGEIRYLPKEEAADGSEKAVFSFLKIATRLGFAAAALLVGFALLAVFGKIAPSVESAVDREALPSLGIGFVITIVLPVAAGMAMLFIVTIPLVMLVLFLYAMALYLAKLPVALWLGGKILRALGGRHPSPYLGLLVGLAILYLAFSLPFFLGKLVYFVTMLVGLGAMVVGVRKSLGGNKISGGPSTPPMPGVAAAEG